MVIDRFLTAVDEVASVTCAVKLNAAAVVGLPDISPVVWLRVNPSGSAPALTDQLYEGTPPVAVSVWLYGARRVPEGRDDVVIDRGVEAAKEALIVWLAVTLLNV